MKVTPENTEMPMVFSPARGIVTITSGAETVDMNAEQAFEVSRRLVEIAAAIELGLINDQGLLK